MLFFNIRIFVETGRIVPIHHPVPKILRIDTVVLRKRKYPVCFVFVVAKHKTPVKVVAARHHSGWSYNNRRVDAQ